MATNGSNVKGNDIIRDQRATT